MSFVAPHIVNRASHTQITSLQSSWRSYFRNRGCKWCRHDSDVGPRLSNNRESSQHL